MQPVLQHGCRDVPHVLHHPSLLLVVHRNCGICTTERQGGHVGMQAMLVDVDRWWLMAVVADGG